MWMMNTACNIVPEAPSPTTQWLMPSLRGWRSSQPCLLMEPWNTIRYDLASLTSTFIILVLSILCLCWFIKSFDDPKTFGDTRLLILKFFPVLRYCYRALNFLPFLVEQTFIISFWGLKINLLDKFWFNMWNHYCGSLKKWIMLSYLFYEHRLSASFESQWTISLKNITDGLEW